MKRSNVKNALPRISFAIPERKSLAPLPDTAAGELLWDEEWIGDDVILESEDDGDDGRNGSVEDEDDFEGNSVTLRDILLKAGGDITQFDLMGE